MIVLGVDTSSKTASCAISRDDKIICSYYSNTDFQHSKTIMPMIESMFKCVEITPNEIELIGVTVGPGSFTGVRIGTAAVKGIAFNKNIPCVSVSSIEAAARSVSVFDGIVCPVMDARCNQFYNALFDYEDGKLNRLCDDRALLFDEIISDLKSYKKPILLVGDGAEIFYNKAVELVDNIHIASPQNRFPKSDAVTQIAFEQYKNDVFTDAESLQPMYLRPPQAVRNLKK